MTQQKYILTPIVGNSHRLAGNLVIQTLPVGQPLLLIAEPDNIHDPEAVKVCVDMYGSQYLKDPQEHLIIHLGYIPRSDGRYNTMNFGNREVLNLMCNRVYAATLTFSEKQKPLVRIELISAALTSE